MTAEAGGEVQGTAVLVHGLWGHPADWRWVCERLPRHGVEVAAVDLPSHRSPTAGRRADAAAVQEAVAASSPPVVAAGWSYGGDVLRDAFVSDQDRQWLAAHFDVRLLDTDHFMLFRRPERIADPLVDALDAAHGER